MAFKEYSPLFFFKMLFYYYCCYFFISFNFLMNWPIKGLLEFHSAKCRNRPKKNPYQWDPNASLLRYFRHSFLLPFLPHFLTFCPACPLTFSCLLSFFLLSFLPAFLPSLFPSFLPCFLHIFPPSCPPLLLSFLPSFLCFHPIFTVNHILIFFHLLSFPHRPFLLSPFPSVASFPPFSLPLSLFFHLFPSLSFLHPPLSPTPFHLIYDNCAERRPTLCCLGVFFLLPSFVCIITHHALLAQHQRCHQLLLFHFLAVCVFCFCLCLY